MRYLVLLFIFLISACSLPVSIREVENKMGLEMMGFTRANLDELWIDQSEYKDTLSRSVAILAKAGMNVSVYNHQLCLINSDVLPYYRKSISDWKNEFAEECNGCAKRDECGGFFSSGIKFGYSPNLKPFN